MFGRKKREHELEKEIIELQYRNKQLEQEIKHLKELMRINAQNNTRPNNIYYEEEPILNHRNDFINNNYTKKEEIHDIYQHDNHLDKIQDRIDKFNDILNNYI